MIYHKSAIENMRRAREQAETYGIAIASHIGIGDALQFSSLPENFFIGRNGKKLYDISKPWFFDHNPFVVRDDRVRIDKKTQLWNFPSQFEWPSPRKEDKPKVYLSNAEIWASVFNVPVVLNRPRLYRFEDFPFEKRKIILLQIGGRSHGEMPQHIVEHVIKKYAPTNQLYTIGLENFETKYGLRKIETSSLWDLAEVISQARMFIGIDSGPSWISACYPDVVTKIVRTKPNPPELFKDWIPLEQRNIHSHWDSRERITHNVSEKDVGFTYSYRRI